MGGSPRYACTVVADLVPGREEEAASIVTEQRVPVIRKQAGHRRYRYIYGSSPPSGTNCGRLGESRG